MAYSKILPIKTTEHLQYGINYITDKTKTNEQRFVLSHYCTPMFAADDFEIIYKMGSGSGNIRAHHIVQSFDPEDNITSEQAFEIGQELMRRRYNVYNTMQSYVLKLRF